MAKTNSIFFSCHWPDHLHPMQHFVLVIHMVLFLHGWYICHLHKHTSIHHRAHARNKTNQLWKQCKQDFCLQKANLQANFGIGPVQSFGCLKKIKILYNRNRIKKHLKQCFTIWPPPPPRYLPWCYLVSTYFKFKTQTRYSLMYWWSFFKTQCKTFIHSSLDMAYVSGQSIQTKKRPHSPQLKCSH